MLGLTDVTGKTVLLLMCVLLLYIGKLVLDFKLFTTAKALQIKMINGAIIVRIVSALYSAYLFLNNV